MRTTQPYGPDGPTLPDDGKRYILTAPRGADGNDPLDKLCPDADHHTIGVYGSADLARRLSVADEMGVCVSFRRIDTDVAEA